MSLKYGKRLQCIIGHWPIAPLVLFNSELALIDFYFLKLVSVVVNSFHNVHTSFRTVWWCTLAPKVSNMYQCACTTCLVWKIRYFSFYKSMFNNLKRSKLKQHLVKWSKNIFLGKSFVWKQNSWKNSSPLKMILCTRMP